MTDILVKDFDEDIQEIDINEKFSGNNGENDFTMYILKPEILEILRKKIDVKLENPIPQDNIGGYIVDVSFCNRTEIIENQFGRSDHKHRGQVSTYSDKINAVNVIWFAQEFRQDHIDEFNNLNKLYDGKRRFHLITPKIYNINGTEYIKFINVTDTINFNIEDDDIEEKQRKSKMPITGFIYNGIETKTYIYKDALKLICNDLASKHENFEEIVKEKKYFNTSATSLSAYPYKVKNTNIFVKTNLNASNVEKQTREILSLFGYSQDILQFKYKL